MDYTVKTSNTLFKDAGDIRWQVFIEEQKFTVEFDDIDERAIHLVLYDGDKPVAVGRTYEEDGKAIMGRIAVIPEFRSRHLGAAVVTELEKVAKAEGYTVAALSAQCRVQGFYEKLGYTPMGEPYFDEYCPHIHMEKFL